MAHDIWRSIFMVLWYRLLFSSYTKGKKNFEVAYSVGKRSHVILLALGFSLLNPNAIFDCIVLIGGNSKQFPGHQFHFLSGVVTSSLIWFSLITYLAYSFSSFLSKEKTWRWLERVSGILMILFGVNLCLHQLGQ